MVSLLVQNCRQETKLRSKSESIERNKKSVTENRCDNIEVDNSVDCDNKKESVKEVDNNTEQESVVDKKECYGGAVKKEVEFEKEKFDLKRRQERGSREASEIIIETFYG